MRWVALICLLAGCDKVIRFEENPRREAGLDDASVDAPPDASITCVNPQFRVDFTTDAEMLARFDPMIAQDGALIAVVDGTLRATSSTGIGYATITSNTTLDMTGGTIQLRLVKSTLTNGVETLFRLQLDDDDFYFFSLQATEAQIGASVAGGPIQTTNVTYSEAAYRYLRIAQAGSQMVFSTSADGEQWNPRHNVNLQGAITALRARIGAGAFNAQPATRTAVFDEFVYCR